MLGADGYANTAMPAGFKGAPSASAEGDVPMATPPPMGSAIDFAGPVTPEAPAAPAGEGVSMVTPAPMGLPTDFAGPVAPEATPGGAAPEMATPVSLRC